MKKIWGYLTDFFRHDFHVRQYLTIALFLSFCLIINFSIDLENGYLDKETGVLKFVYFFLLYAFGYYAVLYSYTVFKKQKDFWCQREFWIKSLLVLGILGLDNSMPFVKPLLNKYAPIEIYYYLYKIAMNVCSLFTILIPLVLFHRYKEKEYRYYYGLAPKHIDYKPYLLMLAIMMPLIAIATLNPGFLKQYPMFKATDAYLWFGVPEWLTTALYELVYGLDFITVEFLFRGFMVIGMARVLGRSAILPMATAYCFIHFGKPPGEAVSSIVGGTILGIIALETNSIWGGIMVHIGIAWMMELAAYLAQQ
jgi:hypothetical protein